MNLGRRMVHQPCHDSFEIIHDPNPQVHHNPRVLDNVLLVIDYRKASQSYYYIINTGKLNADWSNKYHLQYNGLCNKASIYASMRSRRQSILENRTGCLVSVSNIFYYI